MTTENGQMLGAYRLDQRLLTILEINGYLKCRRCGVRFEVGMDVATKGNYHSGRYCHMCAEKLNIV